MFPCPHLARCACWGIAHEGEAFRTERGFSPPVAFGDSPLLAEGAFWKTLGRSTGLPCQCAHWGTSPGGGGFLQRAGISPPVACGDSPLLVEGAFGRADRGVA